MHNLTKIRIFSALLKMSWLPACIIVWPLAALRKKQRAKHIFFFDRYALGGAQRVHIDILNSIPELPKLVLFTRKSPNDVMKAAFEAVPNADCWDIHFWCDNLLFRLFAVHYWAFYLNRHRGLKILSSNSTFFYDLLPWLCRDFQRMELLHNFTYGKKGMEFFGFANYRHLDKRLVVDHYTAQNIREQYANNQVNASFNERIQVIEPGVNIPENVPEKSYPPLKVLYAGRGGTQKRVWLIDRIAKHCYDEGWSVVFHFAGDADGELSEAVKQASVLHGRISNAQKMQALYAECHVIILTSAYEGFPMFIKEGMAQGCIPLVTALPGNKTHLKHLANALLIGIPEDEHQVVEQGIQYIRLLAEDKSLRKQLNEAAISYAAKYFNKEIFMLAYRNLLV